MGKKRRAYKPATVNVDIDGQSRPFKITVDGTIYYMEQREVRPKNIEDVMIASKQGKPTVTRSTWHKVKNTTIERLVFAQYLEDLGERHADASAVETEADVS
jgi:hypothetical protein